MPPDLERQAALLQWYAVHRRRMPWRAEPGQCADPYAVAVSELMLQQTRVDTVIDYFARWMQRFADWPALAAASEEDVLAAWTGLGYYNRARNLQKMAQAVVGRHGGRLPKDAAALRELPGVGPYTAGALQSLCFAVPAALVDGNVARVLARWFAITADVTAGAGKAEAWRKAEEELAGDGPARGDPGSWNQALMELGATVCTPTSPKCAGCPVAAGCAARRLGAQGQIPAARSKAPPKAVAAHYLLLLRPPPDSTGAGDAAGDHVLLGQRPAGGRWAGLWEPIGTEGPQAAEIARQWASALPKVAWQALPPLQHQLTHRTYRVAAEAAHFPDVAGQSLPDVSPLGYQRCKWMAVGAALGQQSGVSKLGQKLLALLLNCPPQPAAS